MLTTQRASRETCLVSVWVWFFFPVKLVFYYAAIDNYYLCFGVVPKVAKIFLKPPWGRKWPLFMVTLYFSATFKDRLLFIPHKQFCLL